MECPRCGLELYGDTLHTTAEECLRATQRLVGHLKAAITDRDAVLTALRIAVLRDPERHNTRS